MANDDYGHVAMPKLYGAPAYARPPIAPVEPVERPVSPDDLPLESQQTDEERAMIQGLHGDRTDAGQADLVAAGANGNGSRRGRSFGLRSIAGLVLGDKDGTTTG